MQTLGWDVTPVGEIETWPQSLRTALSICLTARFPALLFWGTDWVQFYNDPYAQLLNPPLQSLGQKAETLWPPEVWAAIYPHLEQVCLTGESTELRHQSVTVHTVERVTALNITFAFSPVLNEQDCVGGVLAVVTEAIEPSREARSSLSMSGDSYHTTVVKVLESITDGFFSLDQQWRVTYFNQASERLSQKTRDQVLGRSLWEIYPGLVNSYFEQQLRHALSEQVAVHFETPSVHPGIWREVHAYPYPEGLSVYWRDITERKQTETQLRRQRKELQLITDSVPACIAYVDCERRYRYVNRAYRDWFGVSTEQLVGTLVEDFVGKTIYEYIRPDIDAVLAGETINAELWMPFEQGPSRHVRRQYIPDRDEQGNVRGFYALVNDITDLKQTEAALRQSEERFRQMAETIEDVFWIAQMEDYQVLYVSPAYEKIWGRTCAELYADPHSWLESIYPADREQARTAFLKQALTGRLDIEFRIVRPDGSIRWVRDRGFPILTETDPTCRVVGIAEDITERKQVEAAVYRGNERLALLSELSSQLLLQDQPRQFINHLFDQLSVHLGLEVYLNYLLVEEQQKLRLHTYRGISANMAEQIQWLEPGHTICGMVALRHERIVVENLQQSHDPTTKMLQEQGVTVYACHPLLSQGQFIGTLGFGSRNRTQFAPDELALMQTVCDQVAAALERSRLLAALQQRADELTQANQIKDEFLAVLSHELRSPLNPILGWATLLQRRQVDEPTLTQALSTIERNVRLQVQLVDDLLDVSRILRGKLTLKMEPVTLAPTITAALETVRLAAEAKSIQIHTHFEPNVSPVLGDAGRLQQIVWNLLSNAVKFTPIGGRAEVRLEQVESRGSEPGAVAQIAQIVVTDTGKGIQPSFLPYVFEHFRQEDGSTTRQFGGLGLGLAIVRYLTEMHGGTVQADSDGEGKGATFRVSLPILQSDEVSHTQEVKPSGEKAQPLQGIQILVVEDDADTCAFLAFMLQQAGAIVTTATSASAGLEVLDRTQPDVLVSDLGLPHLDGYGLLRKVRSRPSEQGGYIPAIALTAYASAADQQQALAAGFQKHLAKPVEPDHLIDAIAQVLNRPQGQPDYKRIDP